MRPPDAPARPALDLPGTLAHRPRRGRPGPRRWGEGPGHRGRLRPVGDAQSRRLALARRQVAGLRDHQGRRQIRAPGEGRRPGRRCQDPGVPLRRRRRLLGRLALAGLRGRLGRRRAGPQPALAGTAGPVDEEDGTAEPVARERTRRSRTWPPSPSTRAAATSRSTARSRLRPGPTPRDPPYPGPRIPRRGQAIARCRPARPRPDPGGRRLLRQRGRLRLAGQGRRAPAGDGRPRRGGPGPFGPALRPGDRPPSRARLRRRLVLRARLAERLRRPRRPPRQNRARPPGADPGRPRLARRLRPQGADQDARSHRRRRLPGRYPGRRRPAAEVGRYRRGPLHRHQVLDEEGPQARRQGGEGRQARREGRQTGPEGRRGHEGRQGSEGQARGLRRRGLALEGRPDPPRAEAPGRARPPQERPGRVVARRRRGRPPRPRLGRGGHPPRRRPACLAVDETPHDASRMFGRPYVDAFLIDTRTGERKAVAERLAHLIGPSPGGTLCALLSGRAVPRLRRRDGQDGLPDRGPEVLVRRRRRRPPDARAVALPARGLDQGRRDGPAPRPLRRLGGPSRRLPGDPADARSERRRSSTGSSVPTSPRPGPGLRPGSPERASPPRRSTGRSRSIWRCTANGPRSRASP